jgi:uncharacterized membrane protein SpoIIM required for sporulation
MKVAELLKNRRRNWQALELLCSQMESKKKRTLGAVAIARFAALYRGACADLALADAYQLPPNTVQYLHQLVGRAHNQLYRSRSFAFARWAHTLLYDVPQRIFRDRCIHLAFILFWGVFLISAYLAAFPESYPGFAEAMISQDMIQELETSFSEPIGQEASEFNLVMASYYIWNNAGIGLQCFASGLLIVPGLFITMFNASFLGACFGYMARPDVYADEGRNFFHFVTAHGPFELTAIVLSAGVGLRLGTAWIITNGMTRGDSLRKQATEAMPAMGAAGLLFFFAALIEAFLSPSTAPYAIKAAVAIVSCFLLVFYFIVLGVPRRSPSATR